MSAQPVDVLAVIDRAALYSDHARIAAQKIERGDIDCTLPKLREAFIRIADNLADAREARAAVAELIEQQQRDAQLVGVLLSYINDNLTDREKGRLGAELMARDLSDHDQRRRAALARLSTKPTSTPDSPAGAGVRPTGDL